MSASKCENIVFGGLLESCFDGVTPPENDHFLKNYDENSTFKTIDAKISVLGGGRCPTLRLHFLIHAFTQKINVSKKFSKTNLLRKTDEDSWKYLTKTTSRKPLTSKKNIFVKFK